MNKEYDLAVALLKLRAAWKELTDISVQVDTDLTDGYPFYLLDFEEITPAVVQWCNIHAGRLIQNAPDRILNPTCLRCQYAFAGIAPDGRCVGHTRGIECQSYPEVPYSRQLVIAAMTTPSNAIEIAKASDSNLLVAYIDYVNTRRKEAETSERSIDA